jgi:hypothetical protein
MGDRREAYRVLIGRREERKIHLGRPRHKWEGNTKRDLQKV